MKVLITSGPTREAIDGVRFITNFSSGETGSIIADSLIEKKFEVIFLYGEGSEKPKKNCEKISYNSFFDLNEKIKLNLERDTFDAIIHLSAVSDYSVEYILSNGAKYYPQNLDKIDSGEELEIKLKKNFKIVEKIKSYAKNNPLLFAFKLTNTKDENRKLSAIEKLFLNGNVDYVVHNDMNEIKDGIRKFYFYKTNKFQLEVFGQKELANKFFEIINFERGKK